MPLAIFIMTGELKKKSISSTVRTSVVFTFFDFGTLRSLDVGKFQNVIFFQKLFWNIPCRLIDRDFL